MIEGLLPEPFNTHILGLVWELIVWHALAKLRMHTELTLSHLDTQTTVIGKVFRHFVEEVCPHFDTYETPAETRARARRNAEVVSHGSGVQGATGHRLKKQLNINTFKFHQMGHYVSNIQRVGTTDSYSTVLVSAIPIDSVVTVRAIFLGRKCTSDFQSTLPLAYQ